jgi:prenyltransferase beta subunit
MRRVAVPGLALTLLFGAALSAAPRQDAGRILEMTVAQEASIQKGIDWLLKTQNRNGLWGCEQSGAPSTAITGLSILALLASGSTPSEGPYSREIRRAVEELTSSRVQQRNGQITKFDSTGMGIFYDHSCATLALAEVYGMRRDGEDMGDLRRSLESAVSYMYSVQNPDGGWGPQGSGSGSDISITCSVWMALRAAHNAGINIANASMQKVEAFVMKCAEPSGGFTQAPSMRGGGGRMFYPTTAGLRVLYGMGKGDLKEAEKGCELLMRKQLGQDYGGQISEWDYCGAFYATMAMMHEGDKYWRKWWPKFRDHLVRIQNADGSWTIQYCLCCRAYATALSILVLEAPKRLLPLYQL